MKLDDLKKINLPDEPGVYFFLSDKNILYIGKATSLKSRVRSYFSPDLMRTRGPVTVDMVFKANALKWQTTPSVLEALILEANLIKEHQPHYNIKEKDNKSFNYVVITRERMPKILIVRGRELEAQKNVKHRVFNKGSVFGPFTSGTQLREALRILRRIFPFIDSSSSKKQNYRFYRELGLTPDVAVASEEYLRNIEYLKLFFRGRKKDIIRSLKQEMMRAAKLQEFEKAGELKRQLFALQHINDVALLKLEPSASNLAPHFRIEAYDIAHMSGKSMTGVMTVVEGGERALSEYRKFRIRTQEAANDTGALAEVIERRLGHPEWQYPDLIVVDGSLAQINAARKVLHAHRVGIPVVSVVKDEHHRPKGIAGDKALARQHESEILLANSEAHRFAIAYHKNVRGKNFLPQ